MLNHNCDVQALQSSMADGGNALGSMQRLVEERTQQALTAQQALMHLQQDHARLTANLQTAQQQAASRSLPPSSHDCDAPGACLPVACPLLSACAECWLPGCNHVMHVDS